MIRRIQRVWRNGAGALALLAAIALVLSNAVVPPAARAAIAADPLAALLEICTVHGAVQSAAADPSSDAPAPAHGHGGCPGCIVAAGAAIGPTSPALPQPRARTVCAAAGPSARLLRPSRRRLRPPSTAPPSRI